MFGIIILFSIVLWLLIFFWICFDLNKNKYLFLDEDIRYYIFLNMEDDG